MSTRRSLSFADDEHEILKEYDKNGGSRFAKEAMKFFLRYRDRLFIMPESINLQQTHQTYDTEIKDKAFKLLKR